MRTKIFTFNKAQKLPDEMEKKINEGLLTGQFKYANQVEMPDTARIVLTVFMGDEASTVKCKVFRETEYGLIEKKLNAFLETGIKMKFCTQSCTGGTVIAILFYE